MDKDTRTVLSRELYDRLMSDPKMRESVMQLCGEYLRRLTTDDARQRAEVCGNMIRDYVSADISADVFPASDTVACFNAEWLKHLYGVVEWRLVGRLLMQNMGAG